MKKFLSYIIVLVLFLGCVYAFGNITDAAGRGDTGTFTVTIPGTYEGTSIGVTLTYDSNVIELVSGSWTLTGSLMADFNKLNGTGVIAFATAQSVTGTILQISYKIKADAPFGTTTPTCKVIFNPSGTSTTVSLGTVSVVCSHNWGAYETTGATQHARTCPICEAQEVANHSWNNGEVTKAATCKEEGVKTYTCTVCNATKTEQIAKTTTHSFSASTKLNDTQHQATCTVCNKTITENHTWNSGTITKKATCKEEGEKTYTCTVCQATKTESIAILTTHTYDAYEKVDDLTHKSTCTVCGKSETANHTWNSGKITKAATCKEAGEKTYTCTGCGATKIEEIAILTTHQFSAWTKIDENTHKRTCKVCEKEETADHNYSSKWSYDKSNHFYVCKDCGAQKDVSAHIPGPEATEQSPQTCKTCGYIIKPALAHTHTWATEWSTDENEHWYACSGCNDKNELGTHVFDNGCDTTCNTCGYTRTTEHSFGEEMKYDETYHWYECSECGEIKAKEEHSAGPEATSTDPQVCTICGKVLKEATGEESVEESTEEDNQDKGTTSIPVGAYVGIGAGLIAIVSLLIILIVAKKKKKKEE